MELCLVHAERQRAVFEHFVCFGIAALQAAYADDFEERFLLVGRTPRAAPEEVFGALQVAEGAFGFYMTVGGDGKPVMKLRDVAYVSNVEFKEKVIPGMVIPGMVVPEAPADAKDAKTNK